MKRQSLTRQRGITTILIVLLLSLAIGATAIAMVGTSRSTQTKQVAVHAATHVNNDVWAAANAVRLYLLGLSEDGITALADTSLTLQISDDSVRTVSANINSVEEDTDVTGSYLLDTVITGKDASADAASVLQVVYRYAPPDDDSTVTVEDAVNLSGNLSLTGGISITGSDGSLQDLSVDGDITINQVNISDLNDIKATGDVNLANGVVVENVYANGDVTLTDTVDVGTVKNMGTVTTSGSASAGTIWANGDVTLGSTGTFDYVNTLGNIYVTGYGSGYGVLKAGQDIEATYFNKIESTASAGDTSYGSWGTLGSGKVAGDLTSCVSSSWENFGDIDVGGSVSSSCHSSIVGHQNVQVDVMDEITEITLTKVTVDVWGMKSDANYVLQYDDILDEPTVTVYDVNGIADGTVFYLNQYFTVNYSNKYGYLCSTSGTGQCADEEPGPAICLGFSEQNDCLSYDASTSTWSFNGAALAPGVIWFDGDLAMGSTTTTSTLLATGSITTSGAYYGAAVNWVGYNDICLAENSILEEQYGVNSSLASVYTSRFENYYPTNLCDLDTETYTSIDVGNIGMAAGGYDPDGDGSYNGGDINLSASSEVWGQVLAGDVITTGGGVSIHGVITSAALGDGIGADGTVGNKLSGSTTVEVDESDTYDGDEVDSGSSDSSSAEGSVNVVWARYQ